MLSVREIKKKGRSEIYKLDLLHSYSTINQLIMFEKIKILGNRIHKEFYVSVIYHDYM